MDPHAFQGMPMGGPKKKTDVAIPKLIANDKNNKFFQFINHAYKYCYIVGSFAKKLLWFASCSKHHQRNV